MLPRAYRVSKEQDFKQLYRGRQVLRSPLFSIRMRHNQLGNPRFGFVISKKVAKKATDRNRLKRWLRASVATQLPLYKTKSVDVLIMAHKNPNATTFTEVRAVVQQVLKKHLHG